MPSFVSGRTEMRKQENCYALSLLTRPKAVFEIRFSGKEALLNETKCFIGYQSKKALHPIHISDTNLKQQDNIGIWSVTGKNQEASFRFSFFPHALQENRREKEEEGGYEGFSITYPWFLRRRFLRRRWHGLSAILHPCKRLGYEHEQDSIKQKRKGGCWWLCLFQMPFQERER